jgi:drug/metabolite transporter (DMT)-like permease|tara:strand:- start:1373 stop:1768 length:396 start_codon:yes stop_codon:yes gene_type:complete
MIIASVKFDKAAIGISALCIVHCLLLPVALALLPSMALLPILGDELFHTLLVALVLPASIVALTLGCKQHKNWQVLIFASAGLLMLCLTAFFGHDYLGESLEKISTIVGASLVAASHVLNFKRCQRQKCKD